VLVQEADRRTDAAAAAAAADVGACVTTFLSHTSSFTSCSASLSGPRSTTIIPITRYPSHAWEKYKVLPPSEHSV